MPALVYSPTTMSSSAQIGALSGSNPSQSGVPQTMPPLAGGLGQPNYGAYAGQLSMPQFQQQIANWSAANPGMLGLGASPQAHTPPLIYSPNTVPGTGGQNAPTQAGAQFYQQHGYYPGG